MKKTLSWLIYDRSLYEQKWKDNKGYARVILNIVRMINISEPVKYSYELKNKQYFSLSVSKISRVFVFVGNNKYFSCAFPFSLSYNNGGYSVQYQNIKLTNKMVSDAISLIHDTESGTFYDLYTNADEESNYSDNVYFIAEKLLTTEPCYVRYDHDSKNENHHIHPAIHLDINMSKDSTFKIGLTEPLDKSSFEDMFNKDKDCFYFCNPSMIEKKLHKRKVKKKR